MSVRWLANVGAEEPLPGKPPPAVACVARLFSLLFGPDAPPLEPAAETSDWPQELSAASDATFPWLSRSDGVFAWLNDEPATRAADAAGLVLHGAPHDVVRRVHDKAFALETCRREGLEPASLRGLAHVFSAEELSDGERVLAEIRRRVDGWPAWIGRRYTLKPRLGGSGRGRVGGVLAPGDDLLPVRRALPRLARRAGALLEPWLEREADLSAQLHVAEDGIVTLLATCELLVSSSGVYRGHRGLLDHRLRVQSGSRHDGELLAGATAVAQAAHAAGFHGPCGVDAFVFRGEHGPELRPVVELNARFTTGTLLAGLLRRARPAIETHVPAPPGQTRRFQFSLEPPAGGWPACNAPERWVIRLGEPGDALLPGLVVTR